MLLLNDVLQLISDGLHGATINMGEQKAQTQNKVKLSSRGRPGGHRPLLKALLDTSAGKACYRLC